MGVLNSTHAISLEIMSLRKETGYCLPPYRANGAGIPFFIVFVYLFRNECILWAKL